MSDFERRWQTCAARAREATAAPAELPAGLATRAWAQFTTSATNAASGVWPLLAWRALVLATLTLAVCLAAEFFAATPANAFTPHLEDLITQVWEIPE